MVRGPVLSSRYRPAQHKTMRLKTLRTDLLCMPRMSRCLVKPIGSHPHLPHFCWHYYPAQMHAKHAAVKLAILQSREHVTRPDPPCT
jgi:hypothetical protein